MQQVVNFGLNWGMSSNVKKNITLYVLGIGAHNPYFMRKINPFSFASLSRTTGNGLRYVILPNHFPQNRVYAFSS